MISVHDMSGAGEFKPESDEEEEEEEESSGGGSSDESLVDSDEEAGDEEDEDDDEEAGLSWEELEEEALQCGPLTQHAQSDSLRPVTRSPGSSGKVCSRVLCESGCPLVTRAENFGAVHSPTCGLRLLCMAICISKQFDRCQGACCDVLVQGVLSRPTREAVLH